MKRSDSADMRDLRVLVVEDNAHARKMVVAVLRYLGVAEIHLAKDGREALDVLGSDETKCDIIICDRNMPRMNGVDLLKQVRSVDPDIPFLMVTADADFDTVKEARSLGVTSYLAKPYAPKDLEQRISAMTKRTRSPIYG